MSEGQENIKPDQHSKCNPKEAEMAVCCYHCVLMINCMLIFLFLGQNSTNFAKEATR